MNKITKVGVIGAGTMGAAIAQKCAQEGFEVVLADKSLLYLEKGMKNIRQMLDEGVQRKVFTQQEMERTLGRIKSSEELISLYLCDLVIEAVYENFDVKANLFTELGSILKPGCIVATNTSSFSVTELAKHISYPERFVGMHFFYHAAKNRLVEIIPGKETSEEVFEASRHFGLQMGKDPIMCKDVNGFAVNRFFVPWLNASVRLLEEGIATKEIIDSVCMEVFGIGMGPFALMNATGVPVAYHSEKTLEHFGKLYRVSPLLEKQALSGKPWELDSGNVLLPTNAQQKIISERMQGVVFFVCSQLLDERVCTAADLDRGAMIGLRWKRGPVEMMKRLGQKETERLIHDTSLFYNMEKPKSIGPESWKTEAVRLEKKGETAIITFDQPQNLNALSEDSMRELGEKFELAENDPVIKTIFITGTGKAFVAGADIKFFVRNIKADRICDIESFTEFGQKIFDRIDKSKKKVVAVMNGLALGGGLELALCADMILALPKAQMAFPETGIGIYPGLGGTQRSSRKIGKALSKYLIHTGKMLSATEAEEIGLVDKVISMDEMFDILDGTTPVPEVKTHVLPEKWQAIRKFFEENSLSNLLSRQYLDHSLSKEESERIIKSISYKAPVALKLADKLIDEEKGIESELQHLREVFSTSDALLGLSSIGQRVNFKGE